MSLQYQMQPMAPKSPQKPERRCFRMMRLPTDWNIVTANQKMKECFKNEIDFKIDSLYMRPNGKLQTALITFSPIIPQELQSGKDWKILIDGNKIVIGSCLDLTTLFESDKKPVKADILFVHGLGGHAIGSWSVSDDGDCWPKDFLGKDLGNVRIMTFGYEARLNKATSISTLSDFAGNLLHELMRLRKATNDHNRPLFLVGHSFGGTIIAKVLHDLKTKKEKPGYEITLKAIRCVTFFGSPHSGMTIKHLEPLTSKREHESMKRTLEDLRKDSEMLRILRETLQDTQTDITFITCVEQQLTQAQDAKGEYTGQSYVAVDANSARLHAVSEIVIPIYGDHRSMIKFSHDEEQGYEKVRDALKVELDKKNSVRHAKCLDPQQRKDLLKCFRSVGLKGDQEHVRPVDDGTCDWLFESQDYVNWIHVPEGKEAAATCLWMKGTAGSGKSTLLQHAVSHSRTRNKDHIILTHSLGVRSDTSYHPPTTLYQHMLLQLIESVPEIPCEVPVLEHWIRDRFKTWQSHASREALEYLVPILQRPVMCFIDGFDECHDTEVSDMAKFFNKLVSLCQGKTAFRLFITTQSNTLLALEHMQISTILLDTHEHHARDIVNFFRKSLHVGTDGHARNYMSTLARKANGNFLWATLANSLLQKDLAESNGTRSVVFERIDVLPLGLPRLIQEIFDATRSSGKESESFMLLMQMVLQAPKALRAEELYKAARFTTRTRNTIIESLRHEATDDIVIAFLSKISGGLLRVSRTNPATVHFVHSSLTSIVENHQRREMQTQDAVRSADNRDSKIVPVSKAMTPGAVYDRKKSECRDILFLLGETEQVSKLSIWEYEHAILNIFHHANEAQRGGIPQREFLATFPHSLWIQLANQTSTAEAQQGTYHDTASLLYVLADMNLAELARELVTTTASLSYLEPEGGMRGTPLFAALWKGNLEIVSVFLDVERQRRIQSRKTFSFGGQVLSFEQHEELCGRYLQALRHAHDAGIMQRSLTYEICTLQSYDAVVDYMTRRGNEILHLFLILAGKIATHPSTFNGIRNHVFSSHFSAQNVPSARQAIEDVDSINGYPTFDRIISDDRANSNETFIHDHPHQFNRSWEQEMNRHGRHYS